jgi:hypothetical protein
MRTYPCVVLLFALLSGTAWGQRCLGHETFRRTRFYLGAGIDVDKYAQTYGVDLRYGKAGVFGMVEAAIKTWGVETFNNESQKLGAAVGVAFSRDETSRFSVCPVVSYRVFDGPDKAEFISPYYHENVFSGSVSVGYLLSQSESWEIVPTLSLEMGTTNPTMRMNPYVGSAVKTFCCGKRGFTTVTTGIGLTLGRVVTILPTVAIPLDEAGEIAYSLHVAISLGRD